MQIIEAATALEKYKEHMQVCASRLSASLELVLRLMQIRFKVSDEEFAMLRAHFNTDASTIIELDNSENSWEDVTNASLSYLIKSGFQSAGAAGGDKGAGKPQNVGSTTSQIKSV